MADAVGVLCVLGLFAVLGGGLLIMLYGVRGLGSIFADWVDRK